MNAMTNDAPVAGRKKKLVLQTVLGALLGGFGMFGLLWLVDERGFDTDRIDHVVALGTALVILLMSAFVGLGALFPGQGAKILNVEDEQELRYERRDLFVGTLLMTFLGVGLIGVALYGGPEGGLLSRETASVIALLSIVGQLAVGFGIKTRDDELNELVAKETCAFLGQALTIIFGGWAVLAHLGWVGMFTPLALVAGINALFLLGLFVSLGRRGALS